MTPNRVHLWVWHTLQHLSWHWYGRGVLSLVLADQAFGITNIPSSEGIVILCVTLMFAPIPTVKQS